MEYVFLKERKCDGSRFQNLENIITRNDRENVFATSRISGAQYNVTMEDIIRDKMLEQHFLFEMVFFTMDAEYY